MHNTRAQVPHLQIRKLAPSDLLLRVYYKALETFRKDGEERFKVLYAKGVDIEIFLKQKNSFYSSYDDQSHVVSQLGHSIINNSKCLY